MDKQQYDRVLVKIRREHLNRMRPWKPDHKMGRKLLMIVVIIIGILAAVNLIGSSIKFNSQPIIRTAEQFLEYKNVQ